MQQLVLFQMAIEAQSLNIAAKASLEKQSNLSNSITASNSFFCNEDSIAPRFFDDDEDCFGDIYDEYEDFEVCSRSWH